MAKVYPTLIAASSWAGGDIPDQAFDGIVGTPWTANAGTGWLRAGFVGTATVTSYEITRRDDFPTTNPTAWTFEGSADASSWTTLDTRSGITWPTAAEVKSFTVASPVAYKYYRINITANNGHSLVSISEMSLIGTSTQVLVTGSAASTEIAGGGAASLAFNGLTSPNQSWVTTAGNAAPSWLRFQLGAATVVEQYQITGEASFMGRTPKTWTFEGSNDASSWTTLDTRTNVSWTGVTSQMFTPTTTGSYTYYRLNITAVVDGGSYCSVSELRAWAPVVTDGTVTLGGTAQAATAAFVVATVLAASLAGTVQPSTASFDLSASAQVSLAGVAQAPTGSFDAEVTDAEIDVSLSGTTQPPTAAFGVLTGATAALAGEVQPSVGTFSLSAAAMASLAGTTQTTTAAFALSTADRTTSLVGSARRSTAAFALDGQPVLQLAGTARRATGAFEVETQTTATLVGTVQPSLATFATYVVTPVTPAPLPTGGMAVVAASAFGAVTMQGSQAVYSVSTATTPRARQQIIADGVDITFLRDVQTPDVTCTLLEPLLYGPATLELPQVSACFEEMGVGALSFLRPGAPVEVNLVVDDVVVLRNYYKGVIVAHDVAGRIPTVELGGEVSGRAALRDRQVPIFKRINDIGRQVYDAVHDLGIPMLPYLGPVTGIEVMTAGGVGHDEHIQERLAMAWTRAGRQWTCMPDEHGIYRMNRKDDTTIHGTVFVDDARTVANLRRDISEEPNRIFVTCVTPAGQRVRFGVYPGLIQGPVPDFPGHLQEGDTGEGVRLLIGRLHATGWIKLEDTPGGYDFGITKAVEWFQDETGLNVTGEVNEATWNALWDLDLSGTSLEWAHIEPAAQRRKVREWDRSGSGTILGLNPDYEPDHLVRDRTINLGSGVTRDQAREFARTVLSDSDNPNWVGTITFHTGALVRGDGFEGMTMTEADVMDARELRPGMNLDLPQFAGGTLFHVSACEVDGDGIVTATVDTRFRDAMEVWEIIARNRESRNDPSRRRNRKHRSSTMTHDSIGEWDEIGGYLGNDIPLKHGWNVFQIVAAAEGTISRLRYTLEDAAESAVAVFGRDISEGWLNDTIPAPLTEAGERIWRRRATRNELKANWILYSAGTEDEPCGYGADLKTDDAELTGEHDDDSSWGYRSETRTVLHVAIWVAEENVLMQGRMMWNQLESGV